MKIATYNVNGIRSRLPHLIEWLERESPDIACLQELKAVDTGFPIGAINDAGYGALWAGQASWNGVAVLAKGVDPVESRRGLPGDEKDTQSRYLEVAAHGVLVGCLYLPNGNPAPGPKFDYKLRWFERLNQYGQSLLKAGGPTILCGDYNVVPTPIDAVVPRRWVGDAVFFPESRHAYSQLLAQGWVDAVRQLHPEKGIYTYWNFSYGGGYDRSSGLRMDHLLASPSLSSRLRAAGVDIDIRGWQKPSDHAPAWVELD